MSDWKGKSQDEDLRIRDTAELMKYTLLDFSEKEPGCCHDEAFL